MPSFSEFEDLLRERYPDHNRHGTEFEASLSGCWKRTRCTWRSFVVSGATRTGLAIGAPMMASIWSLSIWTVVVGDSGQVLQTRPLVDEG